MNLGNSNSEFLVKPVLCLDFDGTIRRNKNRKPFIDKIEDIELMPNIENLIWQYRNQGYLILGISNQAGVAHGFKTPKMVDEEMLTTLNLFTKNPFHIVKWCYHDKNGSVHPYNYRSLCRKPDIGMLALMEHEAFEHGYVIDWGNSLFVGDRPEDEQCAKNANIQFIHIDEFLKT